MDQLPPLGKFVKVYGKDWKSWGCRIETKRKGKVSWRWFMEDGRRLSSEVELWEDVGEKGRYTAKEGNNG